MSDREEGVSVRLRVMVPMLMLGFVLLAVLVGCGKNY
jgi:hypothetical protein